MKKIFTVMIIALLIFPMFSMFAPKALGTASETSLQVAEKAATWTISQAISENGGYKWANYLQGGPRYVSTVPFGGSGFGTFYLKLYKQTGNTLYLDYAKGAAHWVISQAVSDSGGYKWPQPDDDIPSPGWWLSPMVSGIGDFLLSMYQTTGDITYREYAAGAARWLMAMAYWGEAGCFIPYNPPGPYGTQAAHGIAPGREAYTATFLLHMYQETKDTTYLPYIRGTAEWLISGPDKVVDANGYKWRFNRPYGSVYPPDGNGQIALFFYEIYEALGDPTYLQFAQGTINWLLSQAVINGNTAKWYDPVTGLYMTLPLSDMGGMQGFWGIPEPNCLLMAVYGITKNPTYLDYAKKLANWITSSDIAVSEGGGYKFPNYQGSSFYSAYQNAKIYNFLSWLSSLTGETTYSNYADGALQWIIFSATESNGGYAWRTIPYFPYNAAWFQSGAAGVGYYLASATTIDRSMVGYWKFDEGSGTVASDSSGNGNIGTLYNGPQWVSGVVGNALRFDGSNDYVRIPHSSSLDITGNEISVEFWMKLTNGWHPEPGASYIYDQILYDKGNAYTSAMIKSTGALRFNIPYVPPYPETNKNNWDANTWYHIAEVFDGAQIRIYVNGVLDKAETVIGSVSRSTINLALGSHCFGGAHFFNGAIDEFAIYNYARTAEEIQSDYASASGLKRILIVNNAGTFGETWYLPDGTPFTLMSFLRDKGFLVDVWTDISGGRALSLDILSSYDVVILPSWFFDVQDNLQYQNALLDYVNQGGGLLFAGQSGFAQTLDESLGFKYVDGGFVDASIVDSFHPIMQGISELPKAGGVFVDWDNVIADTPLPSNVAILARTTDPSNSIALIAFQHGNGRVVAGPSDGLLRPFSPTGVNSWSPTSQPVTENHLLINAINWVARSQAFARAWKDDSSLGLENDRLYLHGLSETGNYRWFFDYLVYKDTGTTWYQPWGELAMLVYPNFQWKTVSTTNFEVNAFTETDKAYLQYSITSGNLKEELTYTIYPGEPYVNVTLSVTNVGSTTENTYAGVQFTTWIAGDYANDYYFVPGYGQGQFTGGTGNINYPDATETWVAEWDQNKAEGCGMLSTKGFASNNAISEDFGNGEGFKYISPNFDLAPGQTSTAYDSYLYFFTGTGWQKTKDFHDTLAHVPGYGVTIKTYCNTEQADLSLDVSLDSPTTFSTPHTFVGLTGMHTFTVPQNDGNGHLLKEWSTGAITDTISLGAGGIFTAFYEADKKPIAVLTVQNDVANLGSDVWFYGDSSYTPDGSRIKSFFFDFDDGTNSGWVYYPTIGAVHEYSVPGEYWTKLKVINNEGLKSEWSAPHKVTVLPPPGYPVACLKVTPPEASVGSPMKFDASASSDPDGWITQYGFDFGDGSPISWTTNPVISHSYKSQGKYCARVTVSDNNNLEAVSGKAEVTIPFYYTDWPSFDNQHWAVEKCESRPADPDPQILDSNLVFHLPAGAPCGDSSIGFFQKVRYLETLGYGRFVINFKMSQFVNGLLGAFFLHSRPPKEFTQAHQEIDVEWWGKENSYFIHYVFWKDGGKKENGEPVPTEEKTVMLGFPLDDRAYHTCEIYYEPTCISFFFDGHFSYKSNIAISPRLYFYTGQAWAREWSPNVDYFLNVDSTEIWQDSAAPTSSLSFSAKSPVNILLTDPQNRSTGTDPVTGEFVNEIPGAFYTGPYAEPQEIFVPEPLTGIYKLNAAGTGTGSYTLTMESSINGSVDYHEWQGITEAGKQTTEAVLLDTDTRVIVPLQNGASSLVSELNESQKDLYLHLYDSQGRHVGLDYTTNQVDLQIPGSCYRDDGAGIIIIVVPQIINLTIMVDAQYAKGTTQPYDLKVISQMNSGVSIQSYSGNITKGTKDTHHLYVPSNLIPIIDDTPPITNLNLSNPSYSSSGRIYVTRDTTFTLQTEDGSGSGVAETAYEISNNTYTTGWVPYSLPFTLSPLSEGSYTLSYNSTDNAGNIEAIKTDTFILDNTPPKTTLTIGEPKYVSDKTYLTSDTSFTLQGTDGGSGVYATAYRIRNATYSSGWKTYTAPFKLTSLTDGTYTIEYNSTDNVKNTETTHSISVTLFSWNYVFKDSAGRGTVLKINTMYRFFQFIAPGQDFGVRNNPKMTVLKNVIVICYDDSTMRLIAVAVVGGLESCATVAWDKQTGKTYWLIDTPNWRGRNDCFAP